MVSVAPSVRITDADGNAVVGTAVIFDVTAGGGNVAGSPATTNAGGVATLVSWTLGATGVNTLFAHLAGNASGVTLSATASPPSPVLTTLTVSISPSSIQVGGTAQATATGKDQFGASIATGSITWSASAAASISQLGVLTGLSSGQATVQASAGSKTGQALLTITNSPATAIVLSTRPSSIVANRIPFAQQPIVQLVNNSGGTVTAAGVVVTATVSGGSIVGTASATTDANGAAAFSGLALAGAIGSRTITFSANGLGSVTADVSVIAGTPAFVSNNTGDQQTAATGVAVAIAPSVRVTDANANPVPSIPVVFAVTSGGGTVTASNAITNASGIATVGSWILGAAAGQNVLTAIVSGSGITGDPVTFTAMATSSGSTILNACSIQQPTSARSGGRSPSDPRSPRAPPAADRRGAPRDHSNLRSPTRAQIRAARRAPPPNAQSAPDLDDR